MTQIVTDCPHCGAQSMTMKAFGFYLPTISAVRSLGLGYQAYAATVCGACHMPVAISLRPSRGLEPKSWNEFDTKWKAYTKDPMATSLAYGLIATVVRTPPEKMNVPDHLPPAIRKAFIAAETNCRLPDMEEAAASMYRRAIELAVKEIDEGGKGDLLDRINNLATKHILPGTMKDWAHQVRIIGNDGAHDLDGVTRNDLLAAQGFTDALLRYLFTLPAEVKNRREATEKTENFPTRTKSEG